MMILPTSYIALGERTSPRFCSVFSKGCGGGDMADDTILRNGPMALFGSPALWTMFVQAQAEGRTWYYGDHGYFRRGEYYRVTRNKMQHGGHGRAKSVRLDRLGVKIDKWKKGGKHILVCAPDQKFASLMGFNAAMWETDIIRFLAAHTDRPIVVRHRDEYIKSSLTDQLENCWALVTYVSNAAVEAIMCGVPVFCTSICAASTMGLTDLTKIEYPYRPHWRRQWAANLAANQWTLQEIKDGVCWRALQHA